MWSIAEEARAWECGGLPVERGQGSLCPLIQEGERVLWSQQVPQVHGHVNNFLPFIDVCKLCIPELQLGVTFLSSAAQS